MADESSSGERKPSRQARKCAEIGRILVKEEIKARFKQVEKALKKETSDRTSEDLLLLEHSQDIVDEIEKRAKKRDVMKQRTLEIEDSADELDKKCEILAKAIEEAENIIVYTGAGISTAASIPDYRGPNGVWTLLQQGKNVAPQDLSDAVPTVTHMSLTQLYNEGYVKYVVSQNCDGLHLRAGLPRYALSEVHGNMYIEHCTKCKPASEYIRIFDVTEKTALYRHKTERFCHKCNSELTDTIVHFGEKSRADSVYQWPLAAEWVEKADTILCLGSSLKVLKKYSHLWSMDLPPAKRPNIFIVNLQWTPKDEVAALKINGQCDIVMEKVMNILGLKIPDYKEESDPIFYLHTPLTEEETDTTLKKILKIPDNLTPPKWVYMKNQHGKKHHKGKKRKHWKQTPDDNPPTKAAKIKKEELDSMDSEDVTSSMASAPSPDHTYASNSPRSIGVSRSNSPRSVSYSRSNSPRSLTVPPSARSASNALSVSPGLVVKVELPFNSLTPNHTQPNSPKSEGGQSTLSNLIDEVVTKFADEEESLDLDDYLNKPEEKLSFTNRPESLPKAVHKQTLEDMFQTTRWILNQPPMFNIYSQGLGAAGLPGARHPAFPPGYPPFAAQMQFMQMMQARECVPPTSTGSAAMPQKPGASQSFLPMQLPVYVQTSQANSSQVSSAIQDKPQTSRSTVLSSPQPGNPQETSGIESTSAQGTSSLTVSTSSSTNTEPRDVMASKYPILSGFIKIADEEAKSHENPNMPVNLARDALPLDGNSNAKPESSSSNLRCLIDEVVSKFVDGSKRCPDPSQPAPTGQPQDESRFSNRVRQRLFHHIKRRSSQNLLASGESPLASPEPSSSSRTPATNPNHPIDVHRRFVLPPSTLGHQVPHAGVVQTQPSTIIPQGTTPSTFPMIPFIPSSCAPVMGQVLGQATFKLNTSIPALPIFTTGLDNTHGRVCGQGGESSKHYPTSQGNAVPQNGATALQNLERQVQQIQASVQESCILKMAINGDQLPVLPKPEELVMNLRQSLPTDSVGDTQLPLNLSNVQTLPVAIIPVSAPAYPVSAAAHPVSAATQHVSAAHPVSTAGPHVTSGSHPVLAALVRTQPMFVAGPLERNTVSDSQVEASGERVSVTVSVMLEKCKQEAGKTMVSASTRGPKSQVSGGVDLNVSSPGPTSSQSTPSEGAEGSTREQPCALTQLAEYVISDHLRHGTRRITDEKSVSSPDSIPVSAVTVSGVGTNSPDSVRQGESIKNAAENGRDSESQCAVRSDTGFNEQSHKGLVHEYRAAKTSAGILASSSHNTNSSTDQKSLDQHAGCVSVETEKQSVPLPEVRVTNSRKSSRSSSISESSGRKTPVEFDESSKSSTGSEETKAVKEKNVEVGSIPGWFGKGLKKKKKR